MTYNALISVCAFVGLLGSPPDIAPVIGPDAAGPSLLGSADDCNGNGIPDAEDITGGTSQDCNNDAIPDECEFAEWRVDLTTAAPCGTSVAVDGHGSVYRAFAAVVGGIVSLQLIKYDSLGRLLWTSSPIGGVACSHWLAVDLEGNSYVSVGSSSGYLTVKYDAQGTLRWSRTYQGSTGFGGNPGGLAVDGSGNVYVTGQSHALARSCLDIVTVKYSADGDEVWASRWSSLWSDPYGDGSARGLAIAVDGNGNVYVAGSTNETERHNLDRVTLRYRPDGSLAWEQIVACQPWGCEEWDNRQAIAVSNRGSIIVTGCGPYGFGLTVEYSAAGAELWRSIHEPKTSVVAGRRDGGLYVGGARPSDGGLELSAYDAGRQPEWVLDYISGHWASGGLAMVVDGDDNVYVGGGGEVLAYDRHGTGLWSDAVAGPVGLAVDRNGELIIGELERSSEGSRTITRKVLMECNCNGLSDYREMGVGSVTDCDHNGRPDTCDLRLGTLEDCNDNQVVDCVEVEAATEALQELRDTGSALFSSNGREGLAYEGMLAAYGRPWMRGTNRTPSILDADPASRLRAYFRTEIPWCESFDDVLKDYARELWAFEMLLGNEAFADALDPTVQICPEGVTTSCVPVDQFADVFCFQGVPGVSSLLEEELALLRGMALPGGPADWLNEDRYYPNASGHSAAVYNRLPPKAGNVAYKANYNVANDDEAALKHPQGHGDALGYYLSAAKIYRDLFADDRYVAAESTYNETIKREFALESDFVEVPFLGVRNMAAAMAAKAQTILRVADLTSRRDFREGATQGEDWLYDTADPERAWGTADWARRGAVGAYWDWALVNFLLPPADDACESGSCVGGSCVGGSLNGSSCALDADCSCDALSVVNRSTVDGVDELANAARSLQRIVDSAGVGFSPVGLLDNAVPFRVAYADLERWVRGDSSGKSPYDQAQEKAESAISTARDVLKWASELEQRLRLQEADQESFVETVQDSEANFRNELISIFGYASPDDPLDNDLDSTTEALSDEGPDLINFLVTDDQFAMLVDTQHDHGWRPRRAPGTIQIHLSEFRKANLKLDLAKLELANHRADIADLAAFIAFHESKRQEALDIIWDAGRKQMALSERLGQLSIAEVRHGNRQKGIDSILRAGLFFAKPPRSAIGTVAGWFDDIGDVAAAVASPGLFVTGWPPGSFNYDFSTVSEDLQDYTGFGPEAGDFAADVAAQRAWIAREQEYVNTWKDAEITGIGFDVAIEREWVELRGLLRQTPQKMLDIAVAGEEVKQAYGLVAKALAEGNRLRAEQARVRKLQRDHLIDYRWKDLAFRVFKNNALEKYAAFFDFAVRYTVLAGRAYAYCFNDLEFSEDVLRDIYAERRIGSENQESRTGLEGRLRTFDDRIQANDFLPEPVPEVEVGLAADYLGLRPASTEGDRVFRAWLEAHIVDHVELIPSLASHAALLKDAHYGPGIAVFFSTEAGTAANIFGRGPDFPFGGINFPPSRNLKILDFSISFEGVTQADLDYSPRQDVFLIPIGASALRKNTNAPTIDEEPLRMWSVLPQFIPPPNLSNLSENLPDRDYNPWEEVLHGEGGYLNAVRRFEAMSAFVEAEAQLQGDLAGWSAWNTDWLLAIPGHQWTSSPNQEDIRRRVLRFIYGPSETFSVNAGVTEIRLRIRAYRIR